ncbi:MAG: hypothetical protein ACYDAG_12660 [Chloroflexota bacterium]
MAEENGDISDIPYIAGGAVRGAIRDAMMSALIERVGLAGHLSTRVNHFLFSGGALVGGDRAGADTSTVDRMVSLLPEAYLMGGSADGQRLLHGHVSIDDMLPLCTELRGRDIPAEFWPQPTRSAREYLMVVQSTRRDKDANRTHSNILSDEAAAEAAASLQGRNEATKKQLKERKLYVKIRDGRAKGEDVSAAEEERALLDAQSHEQSGEGGDDLTGMMYQREALVVGTPLHWSFRLDRVTDVQFGAFLAGLQAWANRDLRVGGGYAGGYGRLTINQLIWDSGRGFQTRARTLAQVDTVQFINAYDQHLTKHRDEIVDALSNFERRAAKHEKE